MRHTFALAWLAATLAANAHADTAECERHLLATYPFPHRPTAEQTRDLENCDADKLYYGIGLHFDYVRARHCAFAKERHDVLMMLYANGLGVPRNYAVAKMAACRAEAAPAETEARLDYLARMQTGKEGPSPRIDICDHATSSQLGARCAANQASLADQERAGRIESLSTRWDKAEQAALQQLQRSADTFIVARRTNEVDQEGSARVNFILDEDQALRADFLQSLLDFEAGRLPAFSQQDLVRAEREMNQAYERLKAQKDQNHPGAVKWEGIRDTQRTWLAYRDAWLAFGKVRYPAVAPHAWKAYFTQKRTAMLSKLAAWRD